MRKTLGVCLLVLFLSAPVSAGIMQNDKPAPPPPAQPATSAQEPTDGATLDGEIQIPPAPDSLTQIALELLAALPSLL